MKEVYLYGCENCGVVIAIEVNKGNVFFVSTCSGCRGEGRFYERITIKQSFNDDMFGNIEGNRFVVEERSCDNTSKKEE